MLLDTVIFAGNALLPTIFTRPSIKVTMATLSENCALVSMLSMLSFCCLLTTVMMTSERSPPVSSGQLSSNVPVPGVKWIPVLGPVINCATGIALPGEKNEKSFTPDSSTISSFLMPIFMEKEVKNAQKLGHEQR